MGNLMVGAERPDRRARLGADPHRRPGGGSRLAVCAAPGAFSRRDVPAAGLGTREELLDAYERHSGVAVGPGVRCAWWELAGTLRWGVICVMQAFTHLSGARRSVEHAVIGRRACEVEWDLLELLDGRARADGRRRPSPTWRAHPAVLPQVPRLHDRPTADRAARRGPRGARRRRAARSSRGGRPSSCGSSCGRSGWCAASSSTRPEHDRLHAAALARSAAHDERELALAIRDGRLDERRRRACSAAVRATVRAKLEVANPAYLRTTEPDEGGAMNERAARRRRRADRGGRRLHRSRDEAAGSRGRQRPLLRPSPRVLAHRLRGRRDPAPGVGGAAGGDGARAPTAPACGATRCPRELGGRGGSNFALAVVREHLNRLGIGLHNDPQSETSMIGNFPTVILLHEFGTPAQQQALLVPALCAVEAASRSG